MPLRPLFLRLLLPGLLPLAALPAAAVFAAPASGPSRVLTGADLFGLEVASDPQIAPDGRTIVYVRRANDIMTDRTRSSIWSIDVASGRQAPLVTGPITPVLEGDVAARAADLLPPEPWDQDTWPGFTKAVGAATGLKGKALFHPLRLALTGQEHGPELKKLLPLIGRARALARLKGETA